MRILFINPPWVIKRKQSVWNGIASVMPPLGLASMAAVLEQAGHDVKILDMHAERLELGELTHRLEELGEFNLVGVTATTALINNAWKIASIVKAGHPRTRVILGGVHPTVLPEESLSLPAVDLVVRGEAEDTIIELAENKPLPTIDGISFRTPAGFRHNPDRPLIRDLDTLPTPAYHLLPMDKYHPAVGAAKRLPAISMLATRGCPGKCTFCYRLFGNSCRVRSGQKIALEVKLLQDNYGIREICFYDDTFTIFHKQVKAFCQTLDDLNIDLTWSCFSRIDTVNEELLRLMKAHGCHQIMFGLESASPEILRNIGKPVDLEQAEKVVRLTQKVGIDVRAAFMLGNPGETEQSLRETLDFAIKLGPELAIFNITTPFPGTEMFAWADKHGYLTTRNWEDYHHASPVMELPTISSAVVQAFYRRVYHQFFLRPGYLAHRAAKLRSLIDFTNAYHALKAVVRAS